MIKIQDALEFAEWCMQNVGRDNDDYYDVQLNTPIVSGISYRSIKASTVNELYGIFLSTK